MRQYAIKQSYMSYQYFLLFFQKRFKRVFPMTYPYFFLYFSHRIFEGDIYKLFTRPQEEIDQGGVL
jgi:hypothetical protein